MFGLFGVGMTKALWQSLRFLIFATFLFGGLYPLSVWLMGRLIFPPVELQTKIGQSFHSEVYFWGRPSASDYSTMPASPSNFSPTSKKLKEEVEERKKKILKAHPGVSAEEIPAQLLFGSASGIDPDLEIGAIRFQIPRIQRARKLTDEQLSLLARRIDELAIVPWFGFSGDTVVNVYSLNKSLDEIAPLAAHVK